MNDPRYPIGKFTYDGPPTPEQRARLIDDIERAPAALRAAIHGLSPQQIETPYREGGWTVRQVIHHVPESHMNAYIRFKLALTEDQPTIKPYAEDLWAKLPDVQSTPLELSLTLLEFAAWPLRPTAAHYAAQRSEAQLQPPGVRTHAAGEKPGARFLAWPASRGPYHGAAEANGLVGTADFQLIVDCTGRGPLRLRSG